MALPDWVLKHKVKGTEIRLLKGRYYLYAIESKWNKEKKRAQKITKAFLGTITQEGLIPPKRRIESIVPDNPQLDEPGHPKPTDTELLQALNVPAPSVKTYGSAALLRKIAEDFEKELAQFFPGDFNTLIVIAMLRVLYQSPLKNISTYYQHSFLSEMFPNCALSGASLTSLLRRVGSQRNNIVGFMQHFMGNSEHVLVDLTHMISKSQMMNINQPGYNNNQDCEKQINLLYIYAVDQQLPGYYRMLPGHIRDVAAFKLSIKEAGLKNAIVIIDKGFFSNENIEDLEKEGLQYICPLKRNHSLIDIDFLRRADRKEYAGFLLFAKRPVWYFERSIDAMNEKTQSFEKRRIITFIDPYLKICEEQDYLTRIENKVEGYTKEAFFEKQYTFGTLTFITNILDASAEKVYSLYKGRCQIEEYFDTFKNVLGADRTYMQNEQACEAWVFINHLSMILMSKLYSLLRDKDLLKKYSPQDLLLHLGLVKKIKIQGDWLNSEIPKKTKSLLEKLELNIP